MRRISSIVTFVCLLVAFAVLATSQERGGRYDQQIRSNVARVLLSGQEYKEVSAEVEDGIVKLSGNVVLDSARRDLAVQIRHIPHVAGVDNQIVLSPAALPDSILYGRVMSRLQEAGYSDVKAQVH